MWEHGKGGISVVAMSVIAALWMVPLKTVAAPPDWGKAGQDQDTGDGAPSKQPGQRPAPGRWRRPTPPTPGEMPPPGDRSPASLPRATPGPTGTVGLALFWNAQRKDYLTVAAKESMEEALRSGYEFMGWLGYLFSEAHAPCTVPLKLYRHPQKQENVTIRGGVYAPGPLEPEMVSAGYTFIRVEGHVLNLGASDCVSNSAVRKQLRDLAGALTIVDLKVLRYGNDYLTVSEGYVGRWDKRNHSGIYRFMHKDGGAVYGYPPPPPAAAPPPATPAKTTEFVQKPGDYVLRDSQGSLRTTIQLHKSDTVRVRAEGKMNFGGGVLGLGDPVLDPDGEDGQAPVQMNYPYPAPGLRKNSLICGIRPFQLEVGTRWYQCGKDKTFTATDEGWLVLAQNDGPVQDNRGTWIVTSILVTRSAPPPSQARTPTTFGPFQVSGSSSFPVMTVKRGSLVRIRATGIIRFAPGVTGIGVAEHTADGISELADKGSAFAAPGFRKYSLAVVFVEKINPSVTESYWYQAGTDVSFTLDRGLPEGHLKFVVNDDHPEDNSGSWSVTVDVTQP